MRNRFPKPITCLLIPAVLLFCGISRLHAQTNQVAPWQESLYNSGGGYWRGRLALEVENRTEKPVTSQVFELRVGAGEGEVMAQGATVRALRVCDERGRELLFDCLSPDGRLKHEADLQAGDIVFFTVECEARARSRYFLYFDSPDAQPVDDFLKPPGRIENGGFEFGATSPDGWATGLPDEHRRLTWVSEGAHSGQRCVRMDVDKGQEPNWVQWTQRGIPVTPGREYMLRAWVKAENVEGKTGWYVHVNGPKPQLLNKVLDGGGGSHGWKEIVFKFTAPPEATDATIGTVLYGTGTAWYDDAALEALGESPALVAHISPKERMTLAKIPSSESWQMDPPRQCRIPIVVRNFSDKGASDQLVCLDIPGSLKTLLRKANLSSFRVVDPSTQAGRVLPHLRMDKTIAFIADLSPKSERTYYLYLTLDPQIKESTELKYSDLLTSKANLVQNPGFEEGNALPASWQCPATRDGDKVLCNPSREQPGHTGQYCARLEIPADAPLRWSGWRQSVAVEPNAHYFYSAFLKTKDVEGNGVTLHGHFQDAQHKLVKGQWGMSTRPTVTGTSDWAQSSAFFRTPGDAHFLELHLTSNVHGTVWHDSVVLCRMLPAIIGKPEWRPEVAEERTEQPELALWEVNPVIKVFREDPPEAFSGTVHMQLARNEYEPAQIALKSRRAVKGVTVRVLAPKSATGVALNEVSVNPVGYVPVDYPTNYYSSTIGAGYRLFPTAPPRSDGWAGDWPDPLRPNAPFDLPANEAQPVWITVHASPAIAPGEYHGKIIIDLPGVGEKEIPLLVTVWDFELPKSTGLRVIFDMSVGGILKYDKRPDEKSILREWYRNMAEHRACPDRVHPEPKIAFKNGAVEFDANEFDEAARYCLDELGMNSFYAPGIFYTFGWAYPPRKVFGLEAFTPQYDEAVTKSLSVYMNHLRQKGWDKKMIVYVSDEPHYRQPQVVENLAKFCKLVHQVPGARTYSSTWDYVPGLVGAIDIWGAGPHGSFPVERMKERQAAGDDFIFTTDGQMCIDTPYLAIERLLPYLCWKYNVSGYEFWGVCWWTFNPWERGWHKYIQQSDSPDKPKYFVRYPNGDGYLCYPGQPVGVDGPVNSIRFEQVREGLEDYEYFCILKHLIEKAGQKGISVATAEKALAQVSDLVTIPNHGGLRSTDLLPNPDAVPAARVAIAHEILSLRRELALK